MNVIGARIKECRINKELTLEQLAEAVGMSSSSLSLYEKGQRNPKKKAVRKLSEVLGVTEGYLTGEEDRVIKDKLKSNIAKYSSDTNLPLSIVNDSGKADRILTIGESGLSYLIETKEINNDDNSKKISMYVADIYKGLIDSCVNDSKEEFEIKLKKIQDILNN